MIWMCSHVTVGKWSVVEKIEDPNKNTSVKINRCKIVHELICHLLRSSTYRF